MVVVGIDSAKNRVDAVMLFGHRIIDCKTVEVPQPKKGPPNDRSATMKEMRLILTFWLRECKQPCEVFLEDAIAMRNPQVTVSLAQTVGMLLTLPVPVHLVPIDSWKQVAVGKGGASKDAVRAAVLDQFPETDQLFGDRQDLFDATGVALYGEDVLRRRV